MRVVVQRVSQSNVKVSGEIIGEINEGLMVLVSFVDEDNDTDLGWMTKKIINLRIFNDDEGKMNRSCLLYTSPSPRDRTRSRMPSSA